MGFGKNGFNFDTNDNDDGLILGKRLLFSGRLCVCVCVCVCHIALDAPPPQPTRGWLGGGAVIAFLSSQSHQSPSKPCDQCKRQVFRMHTIPGNCLWNKTHHTPHRPQRESRGGAGVFCAFVVCSYADVHREKIRFRFCPKNTSLSAIQCAAGARKCGQCW